MEKKKLMKLKEKIIKIQKKIMEAEKNTDSIGSIYCNGYNNAIRDILAIIDELDTGNKKVERGKLINGKV